MLALVSGGWQLALAVVAVYCVLNFVVQSLIQPRFVGDAVGLSITVTFLSLVFWSWLIGPLGAVLAVPLTLLAKAMLVDFADPVRGPRHPVRRPHGHLSDAPTARAPAAGIAAHPRRRSHHGRRTAPARRSSPRRQDRHHGHRGHRFRVLHNDIELSAHARKNQKPVTKLRSVTNGIAI